MACFSVFNLTVDLNSVLLNNINNTFNIWHNNAFPYGLLSINILKGRDRQSNWDCSITNEFTPLLKIYTPRKTSNWYQMNPLIYIIYSPHDLKSQMWPFYWIFHNESKKRKNLFIYKKQISETDPRSVFRINKSPKYPWKQISEISFKTNLRNIILKKPPKYHYEKTSEILYKTKLRNIT